MLATPHPCCRVRYFARRTSVSSAWFLESGLHQVHVKHPASPSSVATRPCPMNGSACIALCTRASAPVRCKAILASAVHRRSLSAPFSPAGARRRCCRRAWRLRACSRLSLRGPSLAVLLSTPHWRRSWAFCAPRIIAAKPPVDCTVRTSDFGPDDRVRVPRALHGHGAKGRAHRVAVRGNIPIHFSVSALRCAVIRDMSLHLAPNCEPKGVGRKHFARYSCSAF
ncbi:hypothetical protein EXIGLDRAFT_519551 [Exidia glandulosa HHB12029]|uniref:Uncharacterized protein n=1 Tax=Exidia glandulosa HHB12029 TaxID=1314781 RepID=A0A166N1B4_EXIGL|nr:hypothetical protein EXIGLDRAFT_519551 [Exidia glandulosa HHB12029]